MNLLEHRVKKEFILLYTQDSFLETFHKRIFQSIKDNNILILINPQTLDKYIKHEGKDIKIPNLPKLGKLDLENIINSKYMIS
jgi:DNA-directed RNA polymerase